MSQQGYNFYVKKWGVAVYKYGYYCALIDNDFSEIKRLGYKSALEYCEKTFLD